MRRTALVAASLFLGAFLLRAVALDRERGFTGDEVLHVTNARTYAEHGHLGPDNWYHPPLKHLLTYAAIRAAGDDPWGWRLRNVTLGAGTVPLVFLLGELLLGSTLAAIWAALLLALDPLHVAMSRSTFEDIPAAFCLVAALLLSVRHARSGAWPSLLGAGISFGLAVAFRVYALAPLLAVTAALGAVALRRGRPEHLPAIAASLLVVPFILYLGAWEPWFRRGYGFGEWLELQRHAFGTATTASGEGFNPVLMLLARPGRWFLAPVGVGFPAGAGRIQAIMNDPPIWLAVLPATVALATAAFRRRRWELGAIPAAFALLYIPFLLAARPIFLYSSLAVLPFGLLAVGWAARRLPARWAVALATAVAVWCLYLYPLAVGAPAPPARYGPVLAWLDVLGPP